jgi:hypothetical protein
LLPSPDTQNAPNVKQARAPPRRATAPQRLQLQALVDVHSQLFGSLLIGWGSLIASPFFDNRFFPYFLCIAVCARAADL